MPTNHDVWGSVSTDESIIELEIAISKKEIEHKSLSRGLYNFSERRLAEYFIDEKIQELKCDYRIVGTKRDMCYRFDPPTREFQVWATLLVVAKTEDEKYMECLNYF